LTYVQHVYYISMDIITHVFLFLCFYIVQLCAIMTRSINATRLLYLLNKEAVMIHDSELLLRENFIKATLTIRTE